MKSQEKLEALYIKGRNYKHGKNGYSVDLKEAFECFYEAAKEGHVDASGKWEKHMKME